MSDADSVVQVVADVIRPLFRHGGGGGATGISYGWNDQHNGFGIWDNEENDWFPNQIYQPNIKDIDGPEFFARRILKAIEEPIAGSS